ncbi:MAG: hypothetical protein QXH30_00075 [Candidatus Bilamarchaeaceae archaeon]
MASKTDETVFKNEEELISFVEGMAKQLNGELDDLERAQKTESEEEFEKRAKHLERKIAKLQGIVKRNYLRFLGGEQNVASWGDIEVYSWTLGLQMRLTEIRDTNTEGV